MIIKQIEISNFRGVKSANIALNRHSLFVGHNNVGKSTIFEALDLALGPQRLSFNDAINEHDFYQDRYLDNDCNPIQISICVTLGDLSTDEQSNFWSHLEFWDKANDEWIPMCEVPTADGGSDDYPYVLRVEFRGRYDCDEDEFEERTIFKSPVKSDDDWDEFRRSHKRSVGYVYLRSLRTGQRALSAARY